VIEGREDLGMIDGMLEMVRKRLKGFYFRDMLGIL
jgi:hypothetical protein